MRNLLKFIVAHVTHAQLNDINDIKKREREKRKIERMRCQIHIRVPMMKLSIPLERYRRDESINIMKKQLQSW